MLLQVFSYPSRNKIVSLTGLAIVLDLDRPPSDTKLDGRMGGTLR